jgi:hypothetical protein
MKIRIKMEIRHEYNSLTFLERLGLEIKELGRHLVTSLLSPYIEECKDISSLAITIRAISRSITL